MNGSKRCDLLKKKWIKFGNVDVEYKMGSMVVTNSASTHAFLIYPKLFISNGKKEVFLRFSGELEAGSGPSLEMVNRHREPIGSCGLNSTFTNRFTWLKYFILSILVPAGCKVEIKVAEYAPSFDVTPFFEDHFKGDVLVVSPGYPSIGDKYNMAFVHTRVQAYQKLGWKVDVASINDHHAFEHYEFEGVSVVKGNFGFFRELLSKRHYDRILIHFFDDRFANVLESTDMSRTKLYFYLHGAETLYRDWPKIAGRYFEAPIEIDDALEKRFKRKDFMIRKYNEMKNAKWVFVTDFTRNRCEELLNIKFKNSEVIPCLIDTELFSYEKKDPELRKKIFVLRKFYNADSYSLDTVVRIILELSHRSFFSDLEFDIYGDGPLHSDIVAPLLQFDNVKIHRTFLTHEEIREVHRTHGIALFPTRFDSQAVSSCEAASSGCAVVTSDIRGVRQFIPEDLGVMCRVENYREYADVIEKMYYDPDYFLEVGRRESESVQSKFDYAHTIEKELRMFEEEKDESYFDFGEISEDPVLTVVVPSYNVEKYLRGTVVSMLDQRNSGKLEILIVNDGSKDRTAEIGRELEELSRVGDRSIVRLIDKENGGHGSTINVGIREARGKYVKVIDGDDTVDSEEFAKLIDILEREDSDIVLNNYIEDHAETNEVVEMKIYTQLKPEIQYRFEDICYPNYGFSTWGPILSCSSYKTEMLKKADFKLSEKTFYVDMELNVNVAVCCDTITYYDLSIYRYLLGRANQSVTMQSYKRNYRYHENVCISMIETYYLHEASLPRSKRDYIVDHLIMPMVTAQYEIAMNYRKEAKAFKEFDDRLKKYPAIYNSGKIRIRHLGLYRASKGLLVPVRGLLLKN